jgi:hypothetical protein
VSLVLALTACGGTSRSVAAYCSYFYGRGGQLRHRWLESSQSGSSDPIAALAGTFAAIPEAASFLHGLAQRAPDDIAPDVETLAQALDRITGQAGSGAADPVGALASGLATGLATTGAEQRVNEYTIRNCGAPPE